MDFAVARRNMVSSQVKTNRVTDPLVIEAMSQVPREKFIPPHLREFAYVDEDLPIGKDRFIFEPMVLARLLQLADVQSNDRALVVGAGAGYSAALLALMARSVVALESDAEMAAWATRALAEVSATNVTVVTGDLTRGKPEQGPFDVILINGAVDFVPDVIKKQLAHGGRLVCIISEGPVGRATLISRTGETFSQRQEFDAATPSLPGFKKQAGFMF